MFQPRFSSEVCEDSMVVEICVDNSLGVRIEGIALTVTAQMVEMTASG